MLDREFNIQEVIRIIFRHKGIVFLCIAIVLGVVYSLLRMERPVYKSSMKLAVHEQSVTDVVNDNVNLSTNLTISNQIDVLQSQAFLEQVIKALPPDIYDDYAIYTPGKIGKVTDYIKKIVRSIIGIQTIQLTEKGIALENLFKEISIRHQGGGVIQVSFKSGNPKKAQRVLKIIGDEFIKFNIEYFGNKLKIVLTYFDKQVKDAYKKMQDAERKMQNYQKEKGVTSVDGESFQLSMRLNSLEASNTEVETQLELSKKRLLLLDEKMIELAQKFPEINKLDDYMPQITSLKNRLQRLEKERLLSSAIYTANHPKMVSVSSQVEKIISDLRSLTRNVLGDTTNVVNDVLSWQDLYIQKIMTEVEISSLTRQGESFSKLIADYRKRILYDLPEKEAGLLDLKQQFDMAQQSYISLVNNREKIALAEADKVGNVQILTPSILPEVPDTSHRVMKLVFGFIVGSMLGVTMTFFLEWYNTTLRTTEEVETRTNLPVLGAIPDITSLSKADKKASKSDQRNGNSKFSDIFVVKYPNSVGSESFRRLFTEIEMTVLSKDLNGKVLVVTSPGPNEGKSTISSNLAVTMTEMGRRVLLIDSDLRKPSLHKFFHSEDDFGFVEILKNGRDLETLIPKSSDGQKFLDLVASGHSVKNPVEYLSNSKTKQIINTLRKHYDFIVIDTPPVITFSDALFLGANSDGVLLVLRSGKTQIDAVERCKKVLQKSKIPILGVVVNGINFKREYGPSSYYGSYYKSYYHRYNPNPKKRKGIQRTSWTQS